MGFDKPLRQSSAASTPAFLFGNIEMNFLPLTLLIWFIAAWFTHIYVCLSTASWGFLIAGAIVFPIAWFHGTGIWFGLF